MKKLLCLLLLPLLPAKADLIDDLGREAARLRQLDYKKVPNKRVDQTYIGSATFERCLQNGCMAVPKGQQGVGPW